MSRGAPSGRPARACASFFPRISTTPRAAPASRRSRTISASWAPSPATGARWPLSSMWMRAASGGGGRFPRDGFRASRARALRFRAADAAACVPGICLRCRAGDCVGDACPRALRGARSDANERQPGGAGAGARANAGGRVLHFLRGRRARDRGGGVSADGVAVRCVWRRLRWGRLPVPHVRRRGIPRSPRRPARGLCGGACLRVLGFRDPYGVLLANDSGGATCCALTT